MARHLGAGHGEAHVGEEPARAALGDVALRLVVGLCRRGAHDVEAELVAEAGKLGCADHGHATAG
jgi:hypothetical protein